MKDYKIDMRSACYVLNTFMGLTPRQVMNMNAGRVVAIINHVKSQVEKCNRYWDKAHEVLLQINDGVDRSHWHGLDKLALIHELAGGDILKAEQVENITFATVLNWKKISLAQIRDEQNKYMKEKSKINRK
ncbi:MAG: hypothetical protein EA392_02960 [Cryomorphaceae bacterium]|nr:MAG: hypothetical protein EA392_02960 [Cryomorphaceae bacterium]